MATIRVLILYNSEWTEKNGEYRFTGIHIRGIKVLDSTTFEQLVKRVAEVIFIDLSKFVISMKFKFKTLSKHLPPMEILNDFDLDFFLEEASNGFKNLLCITYEYKVNIVEPNDDMRADNNPPATHPSWEESHYYPTIGLSTSQHEVEIVNIEDDGFILDHFGSGNELEKELMPNTHVDVEHDPIEVHLAMEDINTTGY
ncbi:hypothetical protein AB3S75_036964 [Citrus x aurantiifolia]